MTDTLRVLFLADAVFEDRSGGSRVVARELARGLARRGHAVTFLVPRHSEGPPGREETAGVRIVRYAGAGQAGAFVRAGRAAAARLWQAGGFDVVHTHFAYAALGPGQATPRGIPHVRSFYGPWGAEGWAEDMGRLQEGLGTRRILKAAAARVRRVLRQRVERVNLRRSDGVIVLSEHSRGEVRAFGYPLDRIFLIPGGVDTARFTPADDKKAVRRALGLPEDRTVLLSVRRLAARMGLDSLIAAMPRVAARHPDVLLLIGGQGPERERLDRMITVAGMGGHVRLVGFVPDEALADYYRSADLFVLPTAALEGFGLVTVEALACGVPVVATPVGATPEILGGLEPQLMTYGAGPDALAAGLLHFLGGGWARALTADRLRRYVLDRYTWDRHVERVEELYKTLCRK